MTADVLLMILRVSALAVVLALWLATRRDLRALRRETVGKSGERRSAHPYRDAVIAGKAETPDPYALADAAVLAERARVLGIAQAVHAASGGGCCAVRTKAIVDGIKEERR